VWPKYMWDFCMEEATCYPSSSYTAEVVLDILEKSCTPDSDKEDVSSVSRYYYLFHKLYD